MRGIEETKSDLLPTGQVGLHHSGSTWPTSHTCGPGSGLRWSRSGFRRAAPQRPPRSLRSAQTETTSPPLPAREQLRLGAAMTSLLDGGLCSCARWRVCRKGSPRGGTLWGVRPSLRADRKHLLVPGLLMERDRPALCPRTSPHCSLSQLCQRGASVHTLQ